MKVPELLWRGLSRRWRQAVLIAVAVVVPGSVGAGTMAMMPTEADPSSVPGLDGTLPFQEDAALQPFLDAEMLAAVPVVADPVRAVLSSSRVIDSLGQSGIPPVAVDAYVRAAARLATEDPTCGLRWTLPGAGGAAALEGPVALGLRPWLERPADARRVPGGSSRTARSPQSPLNYCPPGVAVGARSQRRSRR